MIHDSSNLLIELKGISKSFGQKVILDKIDLQIHRGQALGIIGPSGTGKSTILRIMAGLLPPDEGEVYVMGQRRTRWVDDLADPIGIGMVFQNAALFDSLTVAENVGFSLYQRTQLSRDKIIQLVRQKLEMVGLADICDRYPAELSGGMRRRVSFARAIMTNPENSADNPEVILYDEPTAGLDPIASTVVEDLIRQLQEGGSGGGTCAIVTHVHSTIRNTADNVVLLYQGQTQWEGTVEELENTDSAIVRQFMSGSLNGPIQIIN
ncbi:MAG: ABC transporter ATP-binding protein [Microcoleaceae cyanobacterium]